MITEHKPFARFVDWTAQVWTCPTCPADIGPQPLENFYISNTRPNKRTARCKNCLRRDINEARRLAREYKQISKARRPKLRRTGFTSSSIARILRKPRSIDRVREAIRCGVHTQSEIAKITRLSKDDLCDVLAVLLLDTREIRTENNGYRQYFIRKEKIIAARKDNVNAGFSGLVGLISKRVTRIA